MQNLSSFDESSNILDETVRLREMDVFSSSEDNHIVQGILKIIEDDNSPHELMQSPGKANISSERRKSNSDHVLNSPISITANNFSGTPYYVPTSCRERGEYFAGQSRPAYNQGQIPCASEEYQSQPGVVGQKSVNSPTKTVGIIGQKPSSNVPSDKRWPVYGQSSGGRQAAQCVFNSVHPPAQVYSRYPQSYPQPDLFRFPQQMYPSTNTQCLPNPQARPIRGCTQLQSQQLSNTPPTYADSRGGSTHPNYPVAQTKSPSARYHTKTPPKDRTSWIHCDICNCDVNSEYQFKIHVEGVKHRKRVESRSGGVIGSATEHSTWHQYRNPQHGVLSDSVRTTLPLASLSAGEMATPAFRVDLPRGRYDSDSEYYSGSDIESVVSDL